LVPVADYLVSAGSDSFEWDRVGEETSEAWLQPVRDAGLDPRKHKVFHHNRKEYTTQPLPFQHDGELGDSGSTIVYRVRAPEGIRFHRPLALKVIVCKESMRPPGPDSNARRLALQEIRNMAAVRHPHIVAYVASYEDYCLQTRRVEVGRRPRPHAIRTIQAMEHHTIKKHIMGIAMYPPGECNLQTFMHECIDQTSSQRSSRPFLKEEDEDHGWWKLPYMLTYFGCLAQAVAYLHRSNIRIRHKDIKPENVIIDQFGLPILTDFGLSHHFETGHHSDGPRRWTLKYADPEASNETTRDERSDIFSLGCVFLEMATVIIGRQPQYAEKHLAASRRQSDTNYVEFKYAEALEGIPGYIDELNHLVDEEVKLTTDPHLRTRLEAVVKVLPVIARMMDSDSSKRPYASELYPSFRHLYDVPGAPGPCHTCEEERQIGGSGNWRQDRGKELASQVATRMPILSRSPGEILGKGLVEDSLEE
jgi:serine/threonine protein kinase